MKHFYLLVLTCVFAFSASAQKKSYFVYETKTLFSLHNLEIKNANDPLDAPIEPKNVVRFAPYFNFGINYNYDFSNRVGFYLGAGVQNMGFITRDSMNNTSKHRAYGLAVPVGLKFGNMKDDKYLFIQGDFFWMFDYKEKYFQGNSKSKSKPSNAVETINFAATAGICYKSFTLGFQYLINDFFSESYRFDYNKTIPSDEYNVTNANIYSFFVGFRTKLGEEGEIVPTKIQQAQARLY
ncbi:MAG: porin family protein [Cytophagaceae bacterium]|jgi:hypothetical protein|nr:porin family protein [Cytophagaceae bacterium]